MPREDGLPDPVTVGDLYLAEILRELRGQKPVPVAPPEETRVKEPDRFQKKK